MSSIISLSDAFRRTTQGSADAVALVDDDKSYTYAELDAWSDSVAAVLEKAGATPGAFVGISMPRGAGVVAAILGVLRAGCAYVPLDPSYPADRLAFMVDDSGVVAVLTAPRSASPLPVGTNVVEMPAPDAGLAPGAAPLMMSDAPAYVIYTSGSTGRPKGCVVRHDNVLALFRGSETHFDFGPDDRWSMFHSYSFDFSVWEIWGALIYGGRIVCVPDRFRFQPGQFVEFLAQERITVLNIVPSVFRHLLASLEGPQNELSIHTVIFGGEAIDTASIARWLSAQPHDKHPQMINMYGITETTVHVTYRKLSEGDLARTEPGTPIGLPLPHLDIKLLDADLCPVESGQPGEMFVSGAGVSAGYLNRPDLTEQRFPTIDGVRYFRSGDLAAWSEQCRSLVYHGRLDDQVQLHGFRIELGEIENVLRSCPDVSDAAVLMQDGETEPILVAYIVARTSDAGVTRRIRTYVPGFLPRHMIPTRFVLLDELPRTASGKTSRKALLTLGGENR